MPADDGLKPPRPNSQVPPLRADRRSPRSVSGIPRVFYGRVPCASRRSLRPCAVGQVQLRESFRFHLRLCATGPATADKTPHAASTGIHPSRPLRPPWRSAAIPSHVELPYEPDAEFEDSVVP